MTTRKIALILARVAGYHGDTKAFTRLLVESHVNRAAMNREWVNGARQKNAGAPCTCHECNRRHLETKDPAAQVVNAAMRSSL